MKDSYQKLITLTSLLSDGEFHDGETLGKHLGITRAAVWKMISKLQGYGIAITSIKGKGYALQEPLILLDKKAIVAALDKSLAKDFDITVLESTPSTVTFLRQQNKSNKISLCIAEHQSTGLGRLGRHWSSPFGLNIYLSAAYQFHCDIADLSGLSLVCSIAVLKTLENYGLKAQIKWPNDILAENKKLAGVLVELSAESNGSCRAIISTGINVNMMQENKDIQQAWTSLRQQSQTYYNRNEICASLIQELHHTIETFRLKGLSHFKDLYHHYDLLYQRPVTIEQFQRSEKGKALGIDDAGRLLLEIAPGQVKAISAGDASLRKKTL